MSDNWENRKLLDYELGLVFGFILVFLAFFFFFFSLFFWDAINNLKIISKKNKKKAKKKSQKKNKKNRSSVRFILLTLLLYKKFEYQCSDKAVAGEKLSYYYLHQGWSRVFQAVYRKLTRDIFVTVIKIVMTVQTNQRFFVKVSESVTIQLPDLPHHNAGPKTLLRLSVGISKTLSAHPMGVELA